MVFEIIQRLIARGLGRTESAAHPNMTGTRDKYRAYKSGEEFADDFSSLMKRKYPDAVGVARDDRRHADDWR